MVCVELSVCNNFQLNAYFICWFKCRGKNNTVDQIAGRGRSWLRESTKSRVPHARRNRSAICSPEAPAWHAGRAGVVRSGGALHVITASRFCLHLHHVVLNQGLTATNGSHEQELLLTLPSVVNKIKERK